MSLVLCKVSAKIDAREQIFDVWSLKESRHHEMVEQPKYLAVLSPSLRLPKRTKIEWEDGDEMDMKVRLGSRLVWQLSYVDCPSICQESPLHTYLSDLR